MKYNLIVSLTLAACASLYVPAAVAQGCVASGVTITSIGCDTVDNVCFVYVSGGTYSPPSCNSNTFRWDSSTTPNSSQER
jgi:hypothetical protein